MIKAFRLYQDDQEIGKYLYPDLYWSYIKIEDEQIELNDDTMNYYRLLMKMSCEKHELSWGDYNGRNHSFSTLINDKVIMVCKKIENTPYLDLYSRYSHLAWDHVKIKPGHDAEIISAVKYDNKRIIFTLIEIKAKRGELLENQ